MSGRSGAFGSRFFYAGKQIERDGPLRTVRRKRPRHQARGRSGLAGARPAGRGFASQARQAPRQYPPGARWVLIQSRAIKTRRAGRAPVVPCGKVGVRGAGRVGGGADAPGLDMRGSGPVNLGALLSFLGALGCEKRKPRSRGAFFDASENEIVACEISSCMKLMPVIY